MKKSKIETIDYINTLEGYEGYVQFFHRPIDLDKDIFIGCNPKVEDEEGFVYEAHFSNGSESIMIRQQNSDWVVSKTDITKVEEVDFEVFHAIADLKVKMAQIWESKVDGLCQGMEVLKLQKIVFAGFENG